jgi:transcriptional regulator with XRE-family HTH domain
VDGLRPYNVGDKIRGLRLRKKKGPVELGRHTGLSAALLSKLEPGKLFPTLPTLLRIALVFSVGLEFFFREDKKIRLPLYEKPNASVFLISLRRTIFPIFSRALTFWQRKRKSTLITQTSSRSLPKRRAFAITRD